MCRKQPLPHLEIVIERRCLRHGVFLFSASPGTITAQPINRACPSIHNEKRAQRSALRVEAIRLLP